MSIYKPPAQDADYGDWDTDSLEQEQDRILALLDNGAMPHPDQHNLLDALDAISSELFDRDVENV